MIKACKRPAQLLSLVSPRGALFVIIGGFGQRAISHVSLIGECSIVDSRSFFIVVKERKHWHCFLRQLLEPALEKLFKGR